MNKKLWMIVGGVLTVAVVIASIGAIAVYAQSPTPVGPWGSHGGSSNSPRGPFLGPTELAAAAQALGMTTTDLSAELKSGKTLSAIATEKGVSLQTVEQAIQTARDAQLTTQINQAVTAGKMTQAKATWLLQGLNAGYLNGPGFFGFGRTQGPHNFAGGPQAQGTQRPTFTPPSGTPSVGKWNWRGGSNTNSGPHAFHLGTTELAAAANALGMTTTDLSSELQGGKTLSQIATEKSVDIKTVMQAIQTARNAQFTTQINQAVTTGKMTQAKANWLLEGISAGYLNGLGFFGFGFGGFGHSHTGGWQGHPTPQPTP